MKMLTDHQLMLTVQHCLTTEVFVYLKYWPSEETIVDGQIRINDLFKYKTICVGRIS
jgi:hypothetical protein